MNAQFFILCSLIAALAVQCSVLNRLDRVNDRLSELELNVGE